MATAKYVQQIKSYIDSHFSYIRTHKNFNLNILFLGKPLVIVVGAKTNHEKNKIKSTMGTNTRCYVTCCWYH